MIKKTKKSSKRPTKVDKSLVSQGHEFIDNFVKAKEMLGPMSDIDPMLEGSINHIHSTMELICKELHARRKFINEHSLTGYFEEWVTSKGPLL